MKYSNELEVILFSKYSFNDARQKELIKWLGTIAQPSIDRQHKNAKRLYLRSLRDTEPIYMS